MFKVIALGKKHDDGVAEEKMEINVIMEAETSNVMSPVTLPIEPITIHSLAQLKQGGHTLHIAGLDVNMDSYDMAFALDPIRKHFDANPAARPHHITLDAAITANAGTVLAMIVQLDPETLVTKDVSYSCTLDRDKRIFRLFDISFRNPQTWVTIIATMKGLELHNLGETRQMPRHQPAPIRIGTTGIGQRLNESDDRQPPIPTGLMEWLEKKEPSEHKRRRVA